MLPQTSGSVVSETSSVNVVKLSIQRTLAALTHVTAALRDLPGRKSIFLISQSLPIRMDYFKQHISYLDEVGIEKLIDKALRAGVVVYSLDPTPLSSSTPDADYDVMRDMTAANGTAGWGVRATGPGGVSARLALARVARHSPRALGILDNFRSGLRALAEGTGGQMAADTDAANALGALPMTLRAITY